MILYPVLVSWSLRVYTTSTLILRNALGLVQVRKTTYSRYGGNSTMYAKLWRQDILEAAPDLNPELQGFLFYQISASYARIQDGRAIPG